MVPNETEKLDQELDRLLTWWVNEGKEKIAKKRGVQKVWFEEEEYIPKEGEDSLEAKTGRYLQEYGYGFRPTTVVRKAPKVGRNDPCPCNSGKKYKKCCGKGK